MPGFKGEAGPKGERVSNQHYTFQLSVLLYKSQSYEML